MYRFSLLLASALCALFLFSASAAFAADILVSGTASASSAAVRYPARYMNDGKTATYWGATTSVAQTVTLDLGSGRTLSASDVVWKASRIPPRFVVSGSNDGATWTVLANQSTNTLKTTHTALSGSYRYLRMAITSGTVGIYEWRVYAAAEAAAPAPTPTPTVSATPTPTPTPTPAAGTYNVKDYGAKADGATDNTAAFKKAIAAASAAGGGVVYAPAGTYAFTGWVNPPAPYDQVLAACIYLPSGVSLKGDGIGQTIIADRSPSFCSGVGAVKSSGIGVSGLTITMAASEQATTGRDGLKLIACSNYTVDSVYAENCYIGMNLSDAVNATITNSTVDNCREGFGMTLWSGSPVVSNVRFSYCTASNTNDASGGIPYGFMIGYQSGDDTHRVAGVTLDHCTMANNQAGGIYSKWTDRLTVTNSTITGAAWWAFYALNSKDFYSAGNTVTGTFSGSAALPYNAGGSTARTSL